MTTPAHPATPHPSAAHRPRHRLAPSILSADFSRLAEEIRVVEAAGVEQIHVDVMDGHFVDNITMGPIVVEALKKLATVPLDVHLMIAEPLRYLDRFVDAGADHISFHVEADSPVEGCIRRLRERGVGVGLAINPETPVAPALELLGEVDMILVMTVHPGFGGQAFIPEALAKIPPLRERERELRRGDDAVPALDIEVDGGIGPETIAEAARAGANVFVAGSAIYRSPDPRAAVKALRERLETA